ncbi:MAG: hypothetical protein OXF08_02120 [Bacteroidetes bacterium]|nr:hypothetical protein [Bacteroidota bacterium]
MPVITTRIAEVATDSHGAEKQLTASETLALRGPCVPGALTFSDAHQKVLAESSSSQSGKVINGMILYDTGASISCFDITAAQKLGLVVIGKTSMTSASHAGHSAPIYSGKLITDQLNINVERAMGASLESMGFIALIGRDVMSIGTLFYHGLDGSVTFSI